MTWNIPVSSGILPATIVGKIEEYYIEKPSFLFTLGYHRKLMNRLDVESGLGISIIGFERKTRIDIPESTTNPDIIEIPVEGTAWGKFYGYPSGTVSDNVIQGNRHSASILYAKVPLNVNYSYKKISLSAGVSMSVLLHSVQKNKGFMMAMQQVTFYDTLMANRWFGEPVYYDSITVIRPVPVPYETESNSGKGLTGLIVAGSISLKYYLFKGVWLNAAYYHSFTPIYTEKYRIAGKSKSRSVMIGLRYYL